MLLIPRVHPGIGALAGESGLEPRLQPSLDLGPSPPASVVVGLGDEDVLKRPVLPARRAGMRLLPGIPVDLTGAHRIRVVEERSAKVELHTRRLLDRFLAHARHPERRVRTLNTVGHYDHCPALPRPGPVALDLACGKQVLDEGHPLVEQVLGVAPIHAVADLFVGRSASAESHLQATVGQQVHHPDLLGDPDRMMQGEVRAHDAEPDLRGALGQGGDQKMWRRDDLEPWAEMVLGEEIGVEAADVRDAGLLKGVPIGGGVGNSP